jgi:hypothetical protein
VSDRRWMAPPSNCRRCKDTGVFLSWNLGGEEIGRACPDCARGCEVFMFGRPPESEATPSQPAAETLVGEDRPAPRFSKPEPSPSAVLYEAETLGAMEDEKP